MRDLLIEYHGRVKASLSIHAFSQFWMTPYGYQTGYPPEYKEMVLTKKNYKLVKILYS